MRAGRSGEPEVRPGATVEAAATCGARDQAELDEVGLDHLLDRIARFCQPCGQRFHPHRAAFVNVCDHRQITPVHRIQAKPILKAHPGARIVYDVRCSDYVRDTIAAGGGEARMWKVGHAFAKTYMREHQCEFGGEVSGHYYFRHKDAYFDSGNLTVLLLMKTLSDQGQSLAEAMEETKKYHISGEINSRVADADAVMTAIENRYKDQGKVLHIDGLSVIGDTWWFNIRKSNTEPLLRLNCEGKTQEQMEKLRDELLGQIRG